MVIKIFRKAFTVLLLFFCLSFFSISTSFAGPSAITDTVDIGGGLLDDSAGENNFNSLLNQTIDPIRDNIEVGGPDIKYGGADAVVIFVIDLFKTYVFPLTIIIATLTAIFGFITIMFEPSEEKRRKGVDYFIRGTVGIVIFVGAEFIFNGLYGVITTISANTDPFNAPSRNTYAGTIYNQIIYPFIKLGMYLIMGGLFVLLLVKAVGYVTDPSEKATEQGKNIIISAALGIVVILISKTLVEAIYSRQELVTSDTDTIFVGGGILENTSQNYQTIFNIVNYILGLIAFTILCFIIYQGYLMLFNSNNEEGIKKMRKNLLYIFGGLLLIGLSYIIVNFVVINP